MLLAAGAIGRPSATGPELAAELAGTRGHEDARRRRRPRRNLVARPRRRPAQDPRPDGHQHPRRAIAAAQLFEVIGLSPEVAARCFPAAPALPGTAGFDRLGRRARRRAARGLRAPRRAPALPDPGFARFRGEGELHAFAPASWSRRSRPSRAADGGVGPARLAEAWPYRRRRLARGRPRRGRRDDAAPRSAHVGRRRSPLDEVEPAAAIVAPVRVVGDEPRRAQPGGPPGADDRDAPAGRLRRTPARAARTRPGTSPDPTASGTTRAIKQVASARFGVTAALPRPGRAARDQDRPGLEARRGRPAAGRPRRPPTSPPSAAASRA